MQNSEILVIMVSVNLAFGGSFCSEISLGGHLFKQENKRKTQKQETIINFLQRERINYLQRNNDKTMDNFLTEE